MKSKKALLLLAATGFLTFASLVACTNDKKSSAPASDNPSSVPASNPASNPAGDSSANPSTPAPSSNVAPSSTPAPSSSAPAPTSSVAAPEITGVAFDDKEFKVAPGAEIQLSAKVSGTGAIDKRVEYSLPASADGLFSIDEDNVLHVEKGLAVVGKSVVVTATSVGDPTKSDTATVEVFDYAQGYADYTNVKGAAKADILGPLEKYTYDNFLGGITFMGNGGYVMYASNIIKGTNTYIPGYGFGALAEGRITEPLTGPGVTAKYGMYWHEYEADDPVSLLTMNAQGSVVSDLAGYTTTSYWSVKMSDTKDSYVYYPETAKLNRPIAVDPDADGMSTKWKFPVKVGAELKYNTNTNVDRLKKYDGQEVALEDYVTPYKIYFTQVYGLKRSAENLDKGSSIAGAQEYYNASADGFNAEAWENIGIKSFVDPDDGLSYLQFEFKSTKMTPFEAMTSLGGGMFQPVPEQFILDCGGVGNTSLVEGVKYWGNPNSDSTELPGDHWLSTGPYTVEAWNKNQNIVFKKNPYFDDLGRYQIAGVHVNILERAGQDENAAFEEFIDGNLSAVGIPTSKLAQYKNDPRTTKTAGSSTFALNTNTCSPEFWEELFGKDGSVYPHKKESDYWPVKPAMSNRNFLKGMSYAIDRVTFGETVGRTASCEYFADAFLIDPENGLSYNRTQAHKDAIADFLEGTDGYGYSYELAIQSFKAAAEELIEAGDYEVGDTITLTSWWQEESDENAYGKVITGFIKDAFDAAETGLNLAFELKHGETYMDCYYAIMQGDFDLGFGGLRMDLNYPLENMEVLKSDNSSGYTLNWGLDTNEVDGTIFYDGQVWSFDGLWNAAVNGGIVVDGASAPLSNLLNLAAQRTAAGDLIVYIWVDMVEFDEKNFAKLVAVDIYATTDMAAYSDIQEYELALTEANATANKWGFDETYGCYIVVVPAATIDEWLAVFGEKQAYLGCEVYAYEEINGQPHSPAGYKYKNWGTDDDPWPASYFDGGLFMPFPEVPADNPANP